MADHMADGYELVPNKAAKSDIWAYFQVKRRIKDKFIDKSEAFCTLCSTTVRNSGGTTNLKTHMERHHPEKAKRSIFPFKLDKNNNERIKEEPPVLLPTQPTGQKTIPGMIGCKTKYSACSVKATSITNAIARFIVLDMRPFSVVENKGFRDLINTLDNRYTIPSRQFFSDTKIPDMYEAVKAVVKSDLAQASCVALTTDGWTSRATESYVTITASFIKGWTLQHYVLQTRALPISHTGSNIAAVIKEACVEWNLPKNPPLVTDNAANMTVAATEAECIPHIGCYAHTLNLAAQKALQVTEVSKLLAKIRRIVSFFHRSTTAAAVLVLKIEQLGLPKHKLIIDVCTRWNSAADMLERFLELQPAVYAALASKDIKNVSKDIASLLESSIDIAEDILTCLKPLRTITTALCTEAAPTISIIMPLQHQLLTSLMAESETDSTVVKQMKKVIVDNLSTRYIQNRTFLQKAALLDPRFKGRAFLSEQDKFEIFNDIATEAASLHDTSLATIRVKTEPGTSGEPELPALRLPQLPEAPPDFPESQGDESDDQLQLETKAVPMEIPEKDVMVVPKRGGFADIFGDDDLQITFMEKKSALEMVTDELRAYKSAPYLAVEKNPLEWWKDQEYKLPILAKLARKVLCIPATSVPSERVFSTAGDIVSAQRANLKSRHVDRLIFLKKNME